ncbi:hypothetical protein BKA70DRAFT_1429889 [Coprinopsis sp. MPI-PUGE-AT-0042]|nr:hypothetical protein BKA70DRAFT_1429889 [Coprinopsis sp. MPI-PUGE-AT-0042]
MQRVIRNADLLADHHHHHQRFQHASRDAKSPAEAGRHSSNIGLKTWIEYPRITAPTNPLPSTRFREARLIQPSSRLPVTYTDILQATTDGRLEHGGSSNPTGHTDIGLLLAFPPVITANLEQVSLFPDRTPSSTTTF